MMEGPTAFSLTPRDKPLRILSTSDWHLGNSRVPAHLICNRLRDVVFPKLADTDLLNIGGDVWDTLMSMGQDVNVIVGFLLDLLHHCHHHNVVVRVLLGTFTHDRDQSSVFELYHQKYQFTNDLRYIDKVYLEYISALDVRILYLPDDLPYESAEACLEVVKEMMTARNWDWVDYVFGHGYFEHMLPPNIPRKPKVTFHISQFKPFVRRYVLMGHIHLSDASDMVLYNNSFDRIAHGEEGSKGCLYITDLGTTAKIQVLENPLATKFITIDLSRYGHIETIGQRYLELVKEKFSDTPGYVRVIHPSAEVRQALRRLTTAHFPNLIYSIKLISDQPTEHQGNVRVSFDVVEYPTPTQETLPQMVFEFLEKNGGAKISKTRVSEILSES
jgi:hypothetical protein